MVWGRTLYPRGRGAATLSPIAMGEREFVADTPGVSPSDIAELGRDILNSVRIVTDGPNRTVSS